MNIEETLNTAPMDSKIPSNPTKNNRSTQQQRLYNSLTIILIEIPAGLLAVILLIPPGVILAFFPLMLLFSEDPIAYLVFYAFCLAGACLSAFNRPSRRLIWTSIFMFIGIVLTTGTITNYFRNLSLPFFNFFQMLVLGLEFGLCLGTALKIGNNLLENKTRPNSFILSQDLKRLFRSIVINNLLCGFWVFLAGLSFESYRLSLVVILSCFNIFVVSLAFGGLDLLRYLIARLIFRPRNLPEAP